MPLPLEKQPIVPNALYAPTIILQTSIATGQILTSAQITLKGGSVDENGKWSPADSQAKTVYLPNIFSLESDISSYSQDVIELFNLIVQLIGNINSVRKVV
ncbi:MAG: hypothetical protein A2Y10_08575 [Planctomycetes bacterium GWF2_41_51]|nr:MAG: hypothetical protein A2Y10_08575 [Planctomycetes bacterium GWF2_41_51]HBG28588.1 hypothetical protein [Phycisphaerales bacterium]